MYSYTLQWDVRSGEITQEYDRHLGAVNTITFVDENRRFVTTSDDKSLRVWEWYSIVYWLNVSLNYSRNFHLSCSEFFNVTLCTGIYRST